MSGHVARHDLPRRVVRQFLAFLAVLAVVVGGLATTLFAATPSASAATQNGYVFNNAWTMPQAGNLAGQYTAPAERQYATDTAVSSFDLTTGRVNVTAKIVPGAQQLPGINYIRKPESQASWQATSQTFVGSPTPANEPSFDLETVASNCGGAVGTAGHQDFSGTCPDSVTITFTFDKPVTDPVLDASGLGGYVYAYQFDSNNHRYARGSFMSQRWNLLTSGVTLVGPQGADPANLEVTPTSFGPKNLNTSPNCYQHFKDQQGTPYETPDMDSAGCGSITLRGTFTSVSFRIDQFQRTFSQYPTAADHTGSAFSANDGTKYADGVNGLNAVPTEAALLPGAPQIWQLDGAEYSLRIPQTGQLGDYVWRDANGNGVQDPGEPGVAGVTATLLDQNGAPVPGVAPQTTDANGKYLFTDLPLGSYKVKFTNLPSGTTFTRQGAGTDPSKDSDPDPSTGTTDAVALTDQSPVDLDVDAGVSPILGSIGDFVWNDANGNGIQDSGETGVPGVTVTLLDGNGAPVAGVAPQTTDASGKYLFTDLPVGTYEVQFSNLPEGTKLSPAGQGGDPAKDSNPDPSTGVTGPVTLTADKPDDLTVDAGVAPILGSIGDFVWRDSNGNGVQDAGEPGVPGVTVTLLDKDGNPVAGVAPVKTDANGHYAFTNLPLGTYSVQFSDLPAHTAFTKEGQGGDPAKDSDADPSTGKTAPVTLTASNPNDSDVDAGTVSLGSIGDSVWQDTNRNGVQDPGESGLAGVTVTLLDANGSPVAGVAPQTTDANGTYLFTDLPLGTYEVKFSGLPPNSTFSPAGQGGDPAKDSNPDPATGVTKPVTLTDQAPDDDTIDAGVMPPLGSIGDFVWRDGNGNGVQDPGEPGVPGVTVTLLDKDGNPVAGVAPVKTDANGHYAFTNLPLGTYSVRFGDLPAHTGLTRPNQGGDPAKDSNPDPATGKSAPITLTAQNPNDVTVDAGIVPLGSLGDTVWQDKNGNGVQDPGEPGLAGVTVTLLDGKGNPVPGVPARKTGADGTYLFTDLPLGTYEVKFSTLPAGTKLSPADQGGNLAKDSDPNPATGVTGPVTLTAQKPDDVTVDAGVAPLLGSIGDRVWQDSNGNGVQDPGEPGVAGVTVTLLDKDGKPVPGVAPQKTDANGNYLFTNLPLGTYEVKFSDLPPGAAFTQEGMDSKADATSGITAPITLTAGAPTVTAADAGIIAAGGTSPQSPGGSPASTGVAHWLLPAGIAAIVAVLGGALLLLIGRRRRT